MESGSSRLAAEHCQGHYRFFVSADDSVEVFLDGNLLLRETRCDVHSCLLAKQWSHLEFSKYGNLAANLRDCFISLLLIGFKTAVFKWLDCADCAVGATSPSKGFEAGRRQFEGKG